jgi:hypothetical protein
MLGISNANNHLLKETSIDVALNLYIAAIIDCGIGLQLKKNNIYLHPFFRVSNTNTIVGS